jgi:predicted RNase H-like nuclease (RuvC/YqgF family)
MNSADDDLYGDLDLTLEKKKSKDGGPGHAKRQKTGGRPYHASLSNHQDPSEASRMKEENRNLKKQLEILREENLKLKRNIGTLYRTAKHEIQRKDDQIEKLQGQLEIR